MAGQNQNKPNGNGSSDQKETDPTVDQNSEENIREEYDFLDSKLDELNLALDFLEQKNDDIHEKLKELLQSNIEIRQQMRNENTETNYDNQ